MSAQDADQVPAPAPGPIPAPGPAPDDDTDGDDGDGDSEDDNSDSDDNDDNGDNSGDDSGDDDSGDDGSGDDGSGDDDSGDDGSGDEETSSDSLLDIIIPPFPGESAPLNVPAPGTLTGYSDIYDGAQASILLSSMGSSTLSLGSGSYFANMYTPGLNFPDSSAYQEPEGSADSNEPVSILPLGDSITRPTADRRGYLYPLWARLMDAGIIPILYDNAINGYGS